MPVSRRTFVLTAATTLVSARRGRAGQRTVTAQEIIDRIRGRVGVPWRDSSTDGFKAGDPATVITGVATTVMATLDVLRRAAAAKQNLVITQEPVFYAANDVPGVHATDPVYLAKKKLIDDERLVVWRFADHWNARRPSESATALAAALGWTGREVPGTDHIYQLTETTLGALVDDVRRRLNIRGGLRTVGRSDLRVLRVFLSPGTTDTPSTMANLPRADLIISGEPREWEAIPYTLDTWAAGQPKGMIAIGRLVSEGPSMQACAAWVKSFVTEVPVVAIPTGDPFWNPAV